MPQSTVISEIRSADGADERRIVAKFIYKEKFSASERLGFHDSAVEYLDATGTKYGNVSLIEALNMLEDNWEVDGILERSAVAD